MFAPIREKRSFELKGAHACIQRTVRIHVDLLGSAGAHQAAPFIKLARILVAEDLVVVVRGVAMAGKAELLFNELLQVMVSPTQDKRVIRLAGVGAFDRERECVAIEEELDEINLLTHKVPLISHDNLVNIVNSLVISIVKRPAEGGGQLFEEFKK